MSEDKKTCCFTGRRPKDLAGYDWNKYRSFGKQFVDYLNVLYKQGTRNFISGGAQGFDQLAFWAVTALKKRYGYTDVNNIVYVPFEGQDNLWKEEGPFGREEYNKMLMQADEVKLLVERDKVSYSGHMIAGYLLDRNRAMVDDSDFVVALYPDDSFRTNSGGTSDCMRYAEGKKKEIHQVTYLIKNNELVFDKVIIRPALEETQKKTSKPARTDIDIEKLADKNIICFDTETTGFGKEDEILQLTITAYKDGEPEVIHSGYYRPLYHSSWPGAMAINHITPEMVSGKPYLKDCVPELKKIFEEADIVVAYNAAFDLRLLEQSIGSGKIEIPEEKVFDPCLYFKNTEPDKGHKLIEAVEFYCPEKKEWFERNAHDASADALATLHVLKAQAERVGINLLQTEERGR